MNGSPIAYTVDAHEVDQLLAVLGLGQDEDRADLCHRLGENRRRQHRALPRPLPEVTLVATDVLDAHDTPIHLELDHAIDEQQGIAVRQDAGDGLVVERQGLIHGEETVWPRERREIGSIIRRDATPLLPRPQDPTSGWAGGWVG